MKIKEISDGDWVLKSDMQVERAVGDSLSNHWVLKNVFIRKLGDINDEIYIKEQIDTVLNFNLKDLGQRQKLHLP